MVLQVIDGTPKWVFLLLGYLLWQASKRLRPNARSLYRIMITPGLFILWGLVGLSERPGGVAELLACWTAGALLGGLLGVATPMEIRVDSQRRLVWMPGSIIPLLRVVLIFGAHYALNVAAALRPTEREDLLSMDTAVSGASAGYFLAWATLFFARYRSAPSVDLCPGLSVSSAP